MIRLLIGGSPCTHWSIAQTKNRETTAEGVGWELFKNYLIALEKYKPDYFLYENNKSMSAAIREQITRELGVEPIMINSALVSAQSRQRLYWTNIPGVDQPEDRGILLRDILESGICWREKAYAMQTAARGTAEDMIVHHQRNGVAEPIYSPSGKPLTEAEMDYMVRETKDGRNHFAFEYFSDAGQDKSACITANIHKGVPYNVCAEPIRIGTIESDAKNKDFDSQQYRVYSPDGKAVTLCGQGGGVGAKTGLYATPIRVGDMPNAAGEINGSQSGRIHSIDGKGVPLQARPNGGGADGAATGPYAIPATANGDWQHNNFVIESADGKTYPVYMVKDGQITIKGKQYPIRLADGFYIIRKLTVTECKRLQTVPDSYIFPVSDTQAYKMLGNGWTVDVIVHILGHVPGITEEEIEVFSMYDGMACGHIALDKLGGAYHPVFRHGDRQIRHTDHNAQFPGRDPAGRRLPGQRRRLAHPGGDAMKVTAFEIKKALAEKHRKDFFLTECKSGSTWMTARGDMKILDGLAIRPSWTSPCFTGYEVKVSRGDFLRDAKFYTYEELVNCLYIVCPKGMIERTELPESVGLMYYDPEKNTITTKKKAIFRKIEYSPELLLYIIYTRLSPDRIPFFSDKAEYFREYLDGKRDTRQLGAAVRSKLVQDNQRMEKELEQVSEFRRHYENYKAIQDVLHKHHIWGWHSGEIAEELDKVLSRKPSADVSDVRRDLERIVARLQSMEATKEVEA